LISNAVCPNIRRQRLKDKGVRESVGIKDGDKAFKFNFWYSESMAKQKAMSAFRRTKEVKLVNVC